MTALTPITAADAVTRPPLPPIDPFEAAVVLGNLWGPQVKQLRAEHVRALAAALVVADSLELGGAE